MKKKLTLFIILISSMVVTGCIHLDDYPSSEIENPVPEETVVPTIAARSADDYPSSEIDNSVSEETVAPTVAWSHTLTNGKIGSALIENGIAYFDIRTDETLTQIESYDLHNRQTRWVISEATDAPLLLGDEKIFLLNGDEGITAISVADGKIIWRVPLPKQGYDEYQMSFGNGLLYFSVRSIIYAMDANSGHILWQRSLPPDFRINQAWMGNTDVYREYDALSYYDRLLYVRLSGAAQNQTQKCLLLAIDALDGQEQWRFPFSIPTTKESPPFMVASRPTLEEGLLFFSDWTGRVYLMDKDTGKLIWQDAVEFPIARPLLRNGHIYIPTRNSLLSLSAETGEVIWSTSPLESSVTSPIRAMEDIILVLTNPLGERQTELTLINAMTGELIDKFEIPVAEECKGCIRALEVESGRLYMIQRQTIIAIDILPSPDNDVN
jgi:outer membrane protein assembly factor BamB